MMRIPANWCRRIFGGDSNSGVQVLTGGDVEKCHICGKWDFRLNMVNVDGCGNGGVKITPVGRVKGPCDILAHESCAMEKYKLKKCPCGNGYVPDDKKGGAAK